MYCEFICVDGSVGSIIRSFTRFHNAVARLPDGWMNDDDEIEHIHSHRIDSHSAT